MKTNPRQNLAASAIALLSLFSIGSLRAETFFLATRTVEVPEAGRVTNSVLCSSRHEIAVLPPPRWKQNFDTNDLRLTWLSTDYASILRLKLSPTWQQPEIKIEELKQATLQRHPKARIVEQFTCYTASGAGVAFDLEETSDDRLNSAVRVAFVPFEAGLAEFTLITPVDQAEANRQQFSHLLNSFRVSTRERN